MTRDEQRQAWRTYAAAAASTLRSPEVTQGDIQGIEDVADLLLKAERQRFAERNHAGDADTKVERPWKCLGQDEREKLMLWMLHNEIGQDEMFDIAERWLREKNGGTQ